MFASLNLLMPTPTANLEAGGETRVEGDSDFSALLETEVSFAEFYQMPEAIPVSTDLGNGELLPADGKNLPFTSMLASLAVAPDMQGASTLADGSPLGDIELELNLAYPRAELNSDSSPAVTLLPPQGSDSATPATLIPALTQTPGKLDARTETTPRDEKPLPPAELLRATTEQQRPARHWVESSEWVTPKAEAAQINPGAANALHYKSARIAVAGPTTAIPVADGDSALQEMPVVAPTIRATSTLDTPRQADNRIAGAKTPGPATSTHIAASLSQFSASTALSRDDTMTSLIATPVRDNAWGEKLGERVMMLAGNQIKTADIRLTPADLGPLRVQLSIDDGVANVTFHAQHALTREAIEQAMPRLREMLAESGLSLGQTSVSDRGTSGDNDRNGGSGPTENQLHDGDLSEPLAVNDAPVRRKSVSIDGLIDTFA